MDTLRGKSVAIHDPSSCLIANAFGAHDHQQNKSPQLHRPENIFLPSCSYRHFPQDQKLWAGHRCTEHTGLSTASKEFELAIATTTPTFHLGKALPLYPVRDGDPLLRILASLHQRPGFLLPHFLGGHFRDFLSNSAKHLPFPNLA